MNRKFKPAFFWPEIYGQRAARVKRSRVERKLRVVWGGPGRRGAVLEVRDSAAIASKKLWS